MLTELLIFFIVFLVCYLYQKHWNIYKYFDKNGVKYLPGYPVLGNIFKTVIGNGCFVEDIGAVYNGFPGERYVGYIQGMEPIFLIRDPQLMKQITIKDFDCFVDRHELFPETNEPIIGNSLIMMKGQRWRDMRKTLTQALTGSKLRHMMPFMLEISNNTIEYLKENCRSNDELNPSDVIRRYTNDVFASTYFGLQINSFKDIGLFESCHDMFEFSFRQRATFFLTKSYPNLAKYFGDLVFARPADFFRDLMQKTIKHRKKNNVSRPDMIQHMIESSKDFTLDELSGQVLFYFVAASGITSVVIMAMHELAINPDIQDKLYQEVQNFKQDITFDNISELKYLDCVLNETLRKWSPSIVMDRVCTKPYVLPPPREGGKPVHLKPGDAVYNVINAILSDAEYFPDPEKFIPERFADENNHNTRSFTFFPFGTGPRKCVGAKFAILAAKILLYNMVLSFKILKSSKTSDPIEVAPSVVSINAKGGTYVKLQERETDKQ